MLIEAFFKEFDNSMCEVPKKGPVLKMIFLISNLGDTKMSPGTSCAMETIFSNMSSGMSGGHMILAPQRTYPLNQCKSSSVCAPPQRAELFLKVF